MPTFSFSCGGCSAVQDVFRSVSDTSEVTCPSCGAAMQRLFTPSVSSHVRGMTLSKAHKESKVRMVGNAERAVKQLERWGTGPSLVPNVDGSEVGSWSDAAKLAREQGKDSSTYSKLAEGEKFSANSRGVDERKWRAAKDALKVLR